MGCVMGFISVYVSVLQINVFTLFLILDGMIELKCSVHSAHLSYMNIVSAFKMPALGCFRSLITTCDPFFSKVVIDNKIWLNSACEPEANGCVF